MAGWSLALVAMLLWPVTRSGYLLGHDMVFTPRQPLDAATFGLGSAPPRAVPVDALVAIAERVVDGAVIGPLAVLLPVVAAGTGAALLMRGAPVWARAATAGVAMWNPYVVERLALGQWALLWCYGALPWLIASVVRARGRAAWTGRAASLAAASITPTGGLIAAVTAGALVTGERRGRREVLATAALAVVLQLPWLVPALVSTASATSDPYGVDAFSARPEHPGGTLVSLLDGGGIWNREVMPASRGGALPWIWLAVLAVAAVYGTRPLLTLLGVRTVRTLALLAGAGLLIAILPSLPLGAAALRGAVRHVPGAGLLRDAQKWVLPLVLLEALLVGAAVARLLGRLHAVWWRAAAGAAALALPLIVLPDAATTLRPTFEPAHYPADWTAVSRRIEHGRGDAAILPWGSYRIFPWAPGRPVVDPAPLLLPVSSVVDDRLAVSGHLLRGEDLRAAKVRGALANGRAMPAALAALGIGWVVVEHGTPGAVPSLRGLLPVYAGQDVSLYRVPGPVVVPGPSAGRVAAVATGDVVAGGTLVFVLFAAFAPRGAWARTRRKTQRSVIPDSYSDG